MRVIKTDVVKKTERIIARTDRFNIRICLSIPIYFEFPEIKLKQCLKKLQQTTPQIRNKYNRQSWERIIKTGELLLQDASPGEIATALELKPSTINCYLQQLDHQVNKI